MRSNRWLFFIRRALICSAGLCAALGCPVDASAFSGSGAGTPPDPFVIADLSQLQEMATSVTAHYRLDNDIDASASAFWNDAATTTDTLEGFAPVGSAAAPFTGGFDGNDFTITGLTINRPNKNDTGLFGRTSGADIRNARLLAVSVVGQNNVGGLIGDSRGPVANCYAEGAVQSASQDAGGLIGVQSNAAVSDCATSGTVSSLYGTAGGLIGFNYRGSILHCNSGARVESLYDCGGLIGVNYEGVVSFCSASGDVFAEQMVGGLVGQNYFGEVHDSGASGKVTCAYMFAGGLIGDNYIFPGGTIARCFALGDVEGTDFLGGLIGFDEYSESLISQCYAMGDVTGMNYLGGLVGLQNEYSSIIECYSIGQISGASYSGGLAYFAGTVEKSYWDSQTSGLDHSSGGTSRTTAQMYQQATFVDWNFAGAWSIAEGWAYPCLPHSPPDLSVRVESDLEEVIPSGGVVVFTVSVMNAGPTTATGIVVESSLPAGLNFVSTSGAAEDPAGYPFATLGELGPFEWTTFTLTALSDGSVVNQVTFAAGTTCRQREGNRHNNDAEKTIDILAPNLALAISADKDAVAPGDAVVYTVSAVNNGEITANAVQVTFALPAGLAFVSTSGAAEDPNGYPLASLGALAPGAATSYTLTALNDGSRGGTASVSAQLGHDQLDRDPSDNSAAIQTVLLAPDLAITLSANLNPLYGDDAPVYTFRVVNQGAIPAENTSVTVQLPPGLDFVATSGAPEDPNAYPDTFLGTLDPGAEIIYTVTAQANAAVFGPASIQATVRSSTTEEFNANNSAVFNTAIAAPRVITNLAELQAMRWKSNGYYRLGNDIDATDTINWPGGFFPVTLNNGSFDGQGHTISGLYINRHANYVGLFGGAGAEAVIRNVALTSLTLITDLPFAGGLVGSANQCIVENCSVSGNLTGTGALGGLIGYCYSTRVTNCHTTGTVNGFGGEIGGLIGHVGRASRVELCYSGASVGTSSRIGALVGGNEGQIIQCYTVGEVAGSIYVGGIVGANFGIVRECYAASKVTYSHHYSGGISGSISGSVNNSYWDVERSGTTRSWGGVGKTTAEMMRRATFVDWDFQNVWNIVEDQTYPFFMWHDPPTTGTGPDPDIWPDRAALDFGAQLANQGASTSQTLRIYNLGLADLSVTSVTLMGSNADSFSIVVDSGEILLALLERRSMTLRFDPATTGAHAAQLRILSDDPTSPVLDIALTGTGVNSAPTADGSFTTQTYYRKTLVLTLGGADADGDPVAALITRLPVDGAGALYQFDSNPPDHRGAMIGAAPAVIADGLFRVIYAPDEQDTTYTALIEWTVFDGLAAADQVSSCAIAVGVNTYPRDPGAAAVTTDSITWNWRDLSVDEIGFKIFAGAGATAPDDASTTTAANAETHTTDGLTPNTQYAFQASVVFADGESGKSDNYTTWTLAATPRPLSADHATTVSVELTVAAGDGNPDQTQYALYCDSQAQWLTGAGNFSSTSTHQTRAEWGVLKVQNLTVDTTYTFHAVARNGALIESPPGPATSVSTLPVRYRLNVQADHGTVLRNPDLADYPVGAIVELTVQPAANYHFSGWSGDVPAGRETDNPLTVSMTGDKALTADFIELEAVTREQLRDYLLGLLELTAGQRLNADRNHDGTLDVGDIIAP